MSPNKINIRGRKKTKEEEETVGEKPFENDTPDLHPSVIPATLVHKILRDAQRQ